jgi:hypothetical protein
MSDGADIRNQMVVRKARQYDEMSWDDHSPCTNTIRTIANLVPLTQLSRRRVLKPAIRSGIRDGCRQWSSHCDGEPLSEKL